VGSCGKNENRDLQISRKTKREEKISIFFSFQTRGRRCGNKLTGAEALSNGDTERNERFEEHGILEMGGRPWASSITACDRI